MAAADPQVIRLLSDEEEESLRAMHWWGPALLVADVAWVIWTIATGRPINELDWRAPVGFSGVAALTGLFAYATNLAFGTVVSISEIDGQVVLAAIYRSPLAIPSHSTSEVRIEGQPLLNLSPLNPKEQLRTVSFGSQRRYVAASRVPLVLAELKRVADRAQEANPSIEATSASALRALADAPHVER